MRDYWRGPEHRPIVGQSLELRVLGTLFLGYWTGKRYNVVTRDREQVWFRVEDVTAWRYADYPDSGEVAILTESEAF